MSAARYRPEETYSAGLALSLTVMGSVPACEWALRFQAQMPWWACAAVPPALLLVLLWTGVYGRAPIGDLLRSLSPAERTFAWVGTAALFLLPTLVTRQFLPLPGMLSVMAVTALVCGTESGCSRFMLAAGAAFLLSTNGIPQPRSNIHLGAFAGALTAALAYGNFFTRVEPFSDAVIPGRWRPLRVALGSMAMAGALTAAALWITPRVQTVPRGVGLAPRRHGAESGMSGAALEVSLLQLMVATVLLCLAMIALVALARWLYNKFRRRPAELMPESIGVPVGRAYSLPPEEPKRRRITTGDPRETIAEWYERFAADMGKHGAERSAAATAEEYLRVLLEKSGLPEPELRHLTAEFVEARYAPEEVTRTQAKSFGKAVKALLARARRTTRPEA